MISAQNRHRPLSGNKAKFLIFFLATLVWISCSKTTSPTRVLTPIRTNSKSSAEKNRANRLDTVNWTVLSKQDYPPISSAKNTLINPFETVIHTISLLIPFDIKTNSESLSRGEEKFAHYYAGALMAIEELEAQGHSYHFNVFDTKRSRVKIRELINEGRLNSADVIIGPYEIENLKHIAEWAKQNRTPMLSPWRSSSNVAKDNMYYYQLRPLIEQYFEAILIDALNKNSPEDIYILAREGNEDRAKIQSIHRIHERINAGPISAALNEFLIDQNSLQDAEFMVFDSVFAATNEAAFIIPNYSSRDSRYVYSVIRKINAEIQDQNISIYGMPTLLNPDRLDLEFFRSLSLLTVDYKFLNKGSDELKEFTQRYFGKFALLPNDDSFNGYDSIILLANLIEKSRRGRGFSEGSSDLPYLNLSAEFKKFSKDELSKNPILSEYAPGDFMVNGSLHLIEYKDNTFRKVPIFNTDK